MEESTSIMSNGEEATRQEQARAQVGALVATANSIKACGQMKHATLEQVRMFLSAVPPLVAEAMQLVEVRAQQSASGRSSASRRADA